MTEDTKPQIEVDWALLQRNIEKAIEASEIVNSAIKELIANGRGHYSNLSVPYDVRKALEEFDEARSWDRRGWSASSLDCSGWFQSCGGY